MSFWYKRYNITGFYYEITVRNIYLSASLYSTYKYIISYVLTKICYAKLIKNIIWWNLKLNKLCLTMCKRVYLKGCWKIQYTCYLLSSLKLRINNKRKTKFLSKITCFFTVIRCSDSCYGCTVTYSFSHCTA